MCIRDSFVGWQPILLVFFMAPFAGLFIAIIQWIITRKHEIAYGPYLALAAFVLVLNWPTIWSRAFTRFNILGWVIPVLMLACLVLMAIMLKSWLMFKERFIYRETA